MEISHNERLRLACNVVICVGRGRKNTKYFINTRERSTTSLLPAVDVQGGVSGTQKVKRDTFPDCALSVCSSEDLSERLWTALYLTKRETGQTPTSANVAQQKGRKKAKGFSVPEPTSEDYAGDWIMPMTARTSTMQCETCWLHLTSPPTHQLSLDTGLLSCNTQPSSPTGRNSKEHKESDLSALPFRTL